MLNSEPPSDSRSRRADLFEPRGRRRSAGRRRPPPTMWLLLAALIEWPQAQILRGPAPCSLAPLREVCRDGVCHPNNEDCPPVTTDPTCGEVPHSGRDGALLTWGLSYKTSSAQECCDRCKLHPKGCNSWTFCSLPICWGLDTGNNHTFGEVCAGSPCTSPRLRSRRLASSTLSLLSTSRLVAVLAATPA